MFIKLLVFVTVSAAAVAGAPCGKLVSMAIPDVIIESADVDSSGIVEFPGGSARTPEFCKVRAVAHPSADSEIHLEVWMPSAAAWNGKFLGTGNGGYSSALTYRDMAKALNAGYATAGHDTGHSGSDLRFGFGHPDKVVDYAYRAVHVMTTTAKLLVREYLGHFADESYFSSCSAGGHQAMSEVQRYPDDYDGVVAGAPANNRIRQTFGFFWGWQALHDADGKALLSEAELKLVTDAAIRTCDAADGLRDGLIDDPRHCSFDPEQLMCAKDHGMGDSCLSETQAEAIRKVYAGAKNPRTGEQIFAGWPKGSESFGEAVIAGWRMYLLDPPEPMRADAFRYFLFHDPSWDPHTIDWDRDLRYAEKELGYLAATEKDLTPFARRGGKLILWAGWADPVVPAADTANYYEGVAKAMGGFEKTQAFARLFIAAGMGHCGGGIGPNEFDTLTALDQWVTKGVAPSKLVASHRTQGKVDRTRPLCPYPQVARYRGTGSIDDEGSFVCTLPALTPRAAESRDQATRHGAPESR